MLCFSSVLSAMFCSPSKQNILGEKGPLYFSHEREICETPLQMRLTSCDKNMTNNKVEFIIVFKLG